MAKMVLKNAYLSIAASPISDHVRSLTINYKAEAPETTAMGETSKTRLGGLLDWSLDVEFNQDYAAGNIDAILYPLVGTSVAIIVRPDAGVKSATNPEFTGNAILTDYDPIAGKVGDVAITKVKLSGNGVLARGV